MSDMLDQRQVDLRQIRHDLANDVNCLSMNVEALHLLRDDRDEFDALIALMRETITQHQHRLTTLLQSIADDKQLSPGV